MIQLYEGFKGEKTESTSSNTSTNETIRRQMPYMVPTFEELEPKENVLNLSINRQANLSLANVSTSTRSSYHSVFSEPPGL